jgi:lipopolysaccharide export system protein LptA
MKKTLYLLAIGLLTNLTACSTAPKGETFAARLMVQGGQAQSIAKKWDAGQHMISKGENLKVKGQDNITNGKAMIAKGEKMLIDGDKMMLDGKREMADAESSYETLRANPVPLPTPTVPTTP